MHFNPHNVYHVYNQGNNKQIIFQNDNDYAIFLSLFQKLICPFSEIIAWCLMPNHFHLMLVADQRCLATIKQGGLVLDPITNGFRKLLSGYARIYNSNNSRSGSLFRQKTKSKCLSELMQLHPTFKNVDYYFNCYHYIHQNPLRAGLVARQQDWKFSSYNDYAGIRSGGFVNKLLAKEYCGYDPLNFMKESLSIIREEFLKG